MEPEAVTLPRGSSFEDRYEILGELGSGSFGRVYQARQLSTGQSVAIKLLNPREGAEDSTAREAERFRRETRICAALSHVHIVQLIDSGETQDGQLYAVFPYVPGETLEQALSRDGALGVRECVRLMTQVLEALACAHAQGIVHRDLNPANLMLSAAGVRRSALVLDFGLGGLAEGRRRQAWQTLTQTREFLGTPLYAAPEQLAGEKATPRSDLYAWGLIFLECLTGRHPFAEKGAAARVLAGGGEVEIPGWLADHRLGELLATVTARDPERRDVTAEALIEALKEIAAGALPIAPSASPASAPPVDGEEPLRSPSMPGPERRLSAIVSADVVGYSRLMAQDEDSTVRTVEAYREEIELHVRQHRGRMHFTGDNFLAEFGSALEAVRCAMEVQRVLRARNADFAPDRRMQFRMGIHLGDVRVEGERLFGTGVNIAARLEGLAHPGGLCISGTVREQLRGKLDLELEDLGEQQVKNIPYPVHAFRARVDSLAEPIARTRRTTTRYWAGGAGVLILLLGVSVAIRLHLEPSTQDSSMVAASLDSLAVLPFVNLSADPDQAYFADGIAEELLNTFARFEGLRVVGRTSSFSFRDSNADLRTIGEALGANVILEGSVRTAGDRVRITAQLVDAKDGFHRWSETYDRELNDILAIQTEIATSIAAALRVHLSPEQRARLATAPTENLEAYQAYLVGKRRLEGLTGWLGAPTGSWGRAVGAQTRTALAEAVDSFQQAIEQDPEFALAYVGLADSYVFSVGDLPEGLAKAQDAAEEALELDDRLGEAYTSLALIKEQRGDFEGAVATYQRALQLNPNYVTAYRRYGWLLREEFGRVEEALALHIGAVELDPLSDSWLDVASDLQALGRFDEARAWLEKGAVLDPDNPWAHYHIARLDWLVAGRLDEAVASCAKAISVDPGFSYALAWLGFVLLDLGDPGKAEWWIDRWEEVAPESAANIYPRGILHAYLGDEAAVNFARKAVVDFPGEWEALGILGDHEISEGRYAEARALYEQAYPELLTDDDPRVDKLNWAPAIGLALVLSKTGEQRRADRLLKRSFEHIQTKRRLGWDGYGWSDVEIFALQGEEQKALLALRRAIDEGWRTGWWYLERSPNLQSLHDEPEFQAMVAELAADMAAQLERVREMERRGELAFPAELSPPTDQAAGFASPGSPKAHGESFSPRALVSKPERSTSTLDAL